MLGMTVPDVNDRQMKMFTAGLKRVMPHSVKQAEAITPLILWRMSKVVKFRQGRNGSMDSHTLRILFIPQEEQSGT